MLGRIVLGLVPMILLLGHTGTIAGDGKKESVREKYRMAFAGNIDDAVVEEFKKSLPRDGKFYIVEGDIGLLAGQIKPYLLSRKTSDSKQARREQELKVNLRSDGSLDVWKQSERHLKFAVARSSFQNESQYQEVVRNIEAAAKEWEDLCKECKLRLEHIPGSDQAPSLGRETFIVQLHDSKGDYIANAFSPSAEKDDRILKVDPSYFTTDYDKVGVMRHEIGHILGYRHEHLGGIPGCLREKDNWVQLTEYDRASTMHGFCGGQGNKTLALTKVDEAGHRRAYGK